MSDTPRIEPVHEWRYREIRDYPIDRIPPTETFYMKHAHHVAGLRLMAQMGLEVPPARWPMKANVELKLTYTDIEQLKNGEVIEKEFKCSDCNEVDTYRFHMRRMGETREVKIQDYDAKEKKDAH